MYAEPSLAGVPFILLTGYDPSAIRAEFADIPATRETVRCEVSVPRRCSSVGLN